MINQDEKKYDLIIIGGNLEASLVFFQASNKGLEIALISENDFINNSGNAYFQLIEPAIGLNFFEILRRKKLITSLKKSFLHLFISSTSENIQTCNGFKKTVLFIYKRLFNRYFKLNKYPHQANLYRYSLPSNKFSVQRMIIELLTKSVQMGSDVFYPYQIKSLKYTNNQSYNLQIENKLNKKLENIQAKKIVRFDLKNNRIHKSIEIADKTSSVVYFTYPLAGLSNNKNKILRYDKQIVKIIPWFECVYFEYIDYNKEKLSIDNALNFIQNYFNDIQIDKEKILHQGKYQILSENENKNRIQAIIFENERQINIKFRPVNQWFNYSNKLALTLIKSKTKNKQSGFGKIIFKGSDLPVSDNPLRIMEYADEKYDEAKQILKSPVYFKMLFYRYGTEVEKITEKAYQYWNETKNSSYSWLKAELSYCIEFEYCKSIDDFINYRSELWMQDKTLNRTELEKLFIEILAEDKNCE